MSNIEIRNGNENDTAMLAAFNTAMAWETEQKRLVPEAIEQGVRRMFSNPELGFYTIIEVDGVAAGALMITTEWSDWRNGIFWWIQSVYIEPGHRRKGLFSMLYQYIRDKATEDSSVCGIRLYVERQNEGAQATYLKAGMIETQYRLYEEEF